MMRQLVRRLRRLGHGLQDTPSKGHLLSLLSQELDNFSGSDLYELCAEAASIPLYEESASLSE